MCLETRRRKTYNTNVRICVANRIEGYKSFRTDNSYEVKISDARGERISVKQ